MGHFGRWLRLREGSMAISKNERPTRDPGSGSLGLLANGSSGPWEVAIDETTTGADRWFAQIEGPLVSFYFEIPSVDIVSQMLQFLESPLRATTPAPVTWSEANGSLTLSKDKKTPVILVRDDEYRDRFFLLVGPRD